MTSHGYLNAVVTRKSKGEGPKQISVWKHNLLTNNGRDLYHAQCLTNNAAGTVGANFIASTDSVITPAAGDTSLTGEIVTNGLSRVIAPTRTHSAGTNSTLLENTFTVTGAGFASVLASALFNASSGVTMTHIANFTTGSGTLAANDTLKISWTINIG